MLARVPGVVPEIRIGPLVDKVDRFTWPRRATERSNRTGLGIDVEKSSDRFPFRA